MFGAEMAGINGLEIGREFISRIGGRTAALPGFYWPQA
jgi:hypothetical protein